MKGRKKKLFFSVKIFFKKIDRNLQKKFLYKNQKEKRYNYFWILYKYIYIYMYIFISKQLNEE